MNIVVILLTSLALAMDEFAISVCKGLSLKQMKWKYAVIAGLYFGLFQGGMALLGYFLGAQFKNLIEAIDHYIAFGLLAIIGINMIRESFNKEKELNDRFDFKTMVPLAIATSIDALAVGVSYAFINEDVWLSIICITVIAFIFGFFGVHIGNKFGSKYGSKAELIGGIVLIIVGTIILIEHLV